jgi:hypothetical protein
MILAKKKPAIETLKEVEDLVKTTKKYMPSARIVLCEILPRYQRNVHWRNIYENKRGEFNTGLKVIGDQYSCILVHCPRLQEDDIIDGIHPSVHSGVPNLSVRINMF